MIVDRELTLSQSSRLEALKAKHAALAERIENEQKYPGVNDFFLRDLKLKKLKLKEEIEEEARLFN